MGKISIVIPVYNGERFLARCIESVIKQTVSDWEIVLVNDGSTDSSGKICDTYAQKDERIRVIHQQNQGYAGARNEGLKQVTGEYVMFVDSDDWIEPDTLETAFYGMESEHADYVIGGVNFVYYTDKSREKTAHIDRGAPKEAYCFEMSDLAEAGRKLWADCGPMYYCVWSRVFRMDIIRNYHLRFNTSLRLQEDVNFTFCYMYHADHVYVSDRVFYNYCREVDKDDTAEKDILEQYFYVEESLINFMRIAYKFRLSEDYCLEMYTNLSEWFIKLAGKIYMESTGLSPEEQRLHAACMSDSFIFRFFCDKLSAGDGFWSEMKKYLEEKNAEALYLRFGEKLQEGVVPPCQ